MDVHAITVSLGAAEAGVFKGGVIPVAGAVIFNGGAVHSARMAISKGGAIQSIATWAIALAGVATSRTL